MSGFEIVGVILGSLPLLIGAADTYRKGFEPLEKWMRFRKDFIKFIDTVDYETKMFNLTLESFLLSIKVSDEELQKLMTDSKYVGWNDEKLGDAMRAKLGTSLDVYMSTMGTMGELMGDLKKLLSLKDGTVDWAKPGASQWDYQLKRLSSSFKKKGPKTVEELSKLNRKIKDLLEVNDKVESMRATRKDTSWGAVFQSIRKHASSLHSAILKSWNCGCATPHVATLALQQRKTADWSSKFNMAFDVVEKGCQTVRCREVVISLLKDAGDGSNKALATVCVSNTGYQERGHYLGGLRDDFRAMSTPNVNAVHRPSPIKSQSDPTQIGIALQQLMPSTPSTRSHGLDSFSKMFNSKKVKKSVRIQNPTSCTLPATPRSLSPNPPDPVSSSISSSNTNPNANQTPTQTTHTPAPSLSPAPTQAASAPAETPAEITSLCSTLQTPKTGCIGYIKDMTHPEHRHELRCPPTSNLSRDSYVTLETILRYTGEAKVNRRQRYKIASILASSLLQLHATPWVIDKISKTNVLFPVVDSKVRVESPFIQTTFLSTPSPSSSFTSISTSHINTNTNTPTSTAKSGLKNLAILLLELCDGQAIETHHFWACNLGRDGQPHNSTDFATAEDWLELVRDEDPEVFLVVDRCLHGQFESKADWGNVRFCQAFWAGVVEPLERLEGLGRGMGMGMVGC